MAKLTDGKRTVEIRMMVWTGNGYTPDWSNDFFDVGLLHMNDNDAHIVEDVEYCIEQAQDWASEGEDNEVFVEDVE